jgi:hypothetical protein
MSWNLGESKNRKDEADIRPQTLGDNWIEAAKISNKLERGHDNRPII